MDENQADTGHVKRLVPTRDGCKLSRSGAYQCINIGQWIECLYIIIGYYSTSRMNANTLIG